MSLPGVGPGEVDPYVAEQVEIQVKYAGYIERQRDEIERQRRHEALALPADFDYGQVRGLSREVSEKLSLSLIHIYHAGVTALEIVLGMVLGTLLGCGSALVLGYSRRARRWLLPALIASQAIPVFAIAPLLVLWLGYGMSSKIAMTMLVIYFPVTANFYDGLRHTQRGWLDLAQVMLPEQRRWAVLRLSLIHI